MYNVEEYSPVINMICIIILVTSLIGFARSADIYDDKEMDIGEGVVNLLAFIILFINVFTEGILYISKLF